MANAGSLQQNETAAGHDNEIAHGATAYFAWKASTRKRISGMFTLVEMLVVIAIIAILASMLMPALIRAKESASLTTCISNAHQISFCFNSYADDYSGYRPTNWINGINKTWNNAFISIGYLKDKNLYRCHAYEDFDLAYRGTTTTYVDDSHIGIGINMNRFWSGVTSSTYRQYLPNLKITTERRPASLCLTTESNAQFYCRQFNYSTNIMNGDMPAQRHHGGGTVLFADSHAAYVPAALQLSTTIMRSFMKP